MYDQIVVNGTVLDNGVQAWSFNSSDGSFSVIDKDLEAAQTTLSIIFNDDGIESF